MFFAAAGLGSVGDLDGVAIDPAGGTFVGPSGITLPNLWFAGDNGAGPAVVSSQSGGSIASSGGAAFGSANGMGLSSTDFQGGPNSTVTALAIAPFDITTQARVLDTGTPGVLTPGTIKIDAGGFTPGPNLAIVAQFASLGMAGGFANRISVQNGILDVAGGFGELYILNFTDPIVMLTLNAPPVTVGGMGYGSQTYPIPAAAIGIGILVQAYDIAAGAISTPVTIVTQ